MLEKNKEKTLVIFKPDVLQRQIVGEIISRFERKGFKIVAMKMLTPSREMVGKHYSDDPKYLIETGEKAKKGAEARGEDTSNWNSLGEGSGLESQTLII